MQHEMTFTALFVSHEVLSGLAVHAVAFLLPLAVSYGLARSGQVRAAWMLPAGLVALSAVFVGFGVMMGNELSTGGGAVRAILTLAVAGVLGGVLGVVFGRRAR